MVGFASRVVEVELNQPAETCSCAAEQTRLSQGHCCAAVPVAAIILPRNSGSFFMRDASHWVEYNFARIKAVAGLRLWSRVKYESRFNVVWLRVPSALAQCFCQ